MIYVGASSEKMIDELLNQLAPGGRIWIPLGNYKDQKVMIYDKDEKGNITS